MRKPSACTETPGIGEAAPYLEAIAKGSRIRTSDFKGKWVILFTHPDDLLPIFRTRTMNYVLCRRKIRAIALMDGHDGEAPVGSILGRYLVKHALTVVDDHGGAISRRLGLGSTLDDCVGEVKGVFVIDPKGVLRMRLCTPRTTERDFTEILKLVDALQAADKQREAKAGETGSIPVSPFPAKS